MRWATYFAALAPALAGTATMGSVVLGWQLLAAGWLGRTSVALLASSAIIGTATYVVFFLIARPSRVEALRAEIMPALRRRRAQVAAPASADLGASVPGALPPAKPFPLSRAED